MGMLIKGTFWFCAVLVVLPFFDGEAQKKLEGAPQIEAADAVTAATGALSYIGEMCAKRPDVCVKGAETVSALGNRAKEGALVAYKLLDKNFSDKPPAGSADNNTAAPNVAEATKSIPAAAEQPMPDAVVTGTVIPVPSARPKH
ncbi:DUF5330 domain-containing protein [Rhizobium sp. C4]|uniref:DUF5330 domain-containing protein n=1 Tax=Rhizobium sp. C4 TaxID=1349800 RepID=UPI001E537180|nr:DUF5330 domain-containing protein [Rhizobium sp. C4]MCD2175556.1 DUF5330 domain-containing protein [Rhizobium sp. C4]